MRLFLILPIILLLTSFKNGEPVATLTCKNASGQIVFEAILPSCKYLESATYKQGNDATNYTMEDKSTIDFKPGQKFFSLHIVSQANGEAKLKANSKTFKLVKSTKGPGTQFHKVYSFKGALTTASEKQPITLNCILDYEL